MSNSVPLSTRPLGMHSSHPSLPLGAYIPMNNSQYFDALSQERTNAISEREQSNNIGLMKVKTELEATQIPSAAAMSNTDLRHPDLRFTGSNGQSQFGGFQAPYPIPMNYQLPMGMPFYGHPMMPMNMMYGYPAQYQANGFVPLPAQHPPALRSPDSSVTGQNNDDQMQKMLLQMQILQTANQLQSLRNGNGMKQDLDMNYGMFMPYIQPQMDLSAESGQSTAQAALPRNQRKRKAETGIQEDFDAERKRTDSVASAETQIDEPERSQTPVSSATTDPDEDFEPSSKPVHQVVGEDGIIKGHWTEPEDQTLLKLVQMNSHPENVDRPKNWGIVAAGIPGRSAKQCRERYHNHLDPRIKKGEWSLEEDYVIIYRQKTMGNKWADIAKQLEGRTENSVKIRWKSIKRQVSAFVDNKNKESGLAPESERKRLRRANTQDQRLIQLVQAWYQPIEITVPSNSMR